MAPDTGRFIQELMAEFEHSLESIKTRLSVEKPDETFSTTNVIGALHLIALKYALSRGVPPDRFIQAMRAVADQLDTEFQTKTGLFAQLVVQETKEEPCT